MKIDIAQLEFIDPMLRAICLYAEHNAGVEFIVTSLYRIGDDGVHGQLPLRGIDLRMRNEEVGLSVVAAINTAYRYDPARPEKRCAILHGVGFNQHIHLQVCDKTVRSTSVGR